MKKQSRFLPALRGPLTLMACVLLAGTLSGCDLLTDALSGLGLLPGPKTPPASPTPKVRVETVTPQRVTTTREIAGRTAPYQIAEVRPQVSGIIRSRNFTEGQDVKAGQTLYQIDPATYKAAYDNACAAFAKAAANLETMRLKAQRYAELVKINAVSQQDASDMQAAHKQALADIAAARAAFRTAKIRLEYTEVRSPIDGRTGISTVTPGALVTEAQGAAMTTVQQLDPMYVDITQSATDLLRLRRALADGRIRSGAEEAVVRLRLEDGSDYALPGRLQFTDVTVDRSTGMVTLRALFPNPGQELLPGMYVRAIVAEGTRDDGILVDQRAVVRDAKGDASVYLVTADGKVVSTPVRLSGVHDGRWVVDEGLKAGDRVVVEGLQRIRHGSTVTIEE